MRPIVLACLLLSSTAGFAQQDAMARYEAAYFKTGVLLRASTVCGRTSKQAIEQAFAPVSSSEFKKISHAYPDLTKKWMLSGAGAFNSSVMSDGVEAACKKALQ